MAKRIVSDCIAKPVRLYSDLGVAFYSRYKSSEETLARVLLCCFGIVLILNGMSEPAMAQGFKGEKYGEICEKLVGLVESSFGAMLTVAAGVGAIVASAMGGFKMAWACLVVSVGSFVLGNFIIIFYEGKCGGVSVN